jgi:hypothetical protein
MGSTPGTPHPIRLMSQTQNDVKDFVTFREEVGMDTLVPVYQNKSACHNRSFYMSSARLGPATSASMPHKFIELLANILLILLAILVPIFAILISVLAKAIDAGRNRIKQNIEDIFRDIEEIRKRTTSPPDAVIDELQKAIRKYSWQRRRAQFRQFFLSTRAAVYYPGLCFLVSLGFLISPLTAPSTEALSRHGLWLIVGSSCLTVLGIGMLCGVLETVKAFAAIYDPPVGRRRLLCKSGFEMVPL